MKDIEFLVRKGTSDYKAFEEVIKNDSYQKKNFKILENEKWLDLGANVGAFSLLASSLGAEVHAFEPDPVTYKQLEKNVSNYKNINIYNLGIGLKDEEKIFYIHPKGAFWRNTFCKPFKNGKHINLRITDIRPFLTDNVCIKMDIEGMEMQILEGLSDEELKKIKKLVFEWSFDVDTSIDRYRSTIKRLENIFYKVEAPSYIEDVHIWPSSWFPPCCSVFCYAKA